MLCREEEESMITPGRFLERRVMDTLIKVSFEAKQHDFQHKEDVTQAMYSYLQGTDHYKTTLERIGITEDAYDELYKLYKNESR